MASEHAERVGEEAALHEGIDVVHAEVDGQIYSIAQMQTAVAQHETDIRDHELRLQAETQARTAGDAAAADALTAEATARAQSDQALDARLTTVESAHPLRVEAFTAHLANAADFVAPTDHVATTLAYTDVVQNTAPDVFTLSPSGGITFQKTGVVTITAHLLVIATDPFAQVEAHVNGAEISRTLARSADSTTYAEVANTLTWKVNAGDTIDFRAYPDQVLLTENGPWSTVTASWTG